MSNIEGKETMLISVNPCQSYFIKGGSRLAPLEIIYPYILCIDNQPISATKYLSLFDPPQKK